MNYGINCRDRSCYWRNTHSRNICLIQQAVMERSLCVFFILLLINNIRGAPQVTYKGHKLIRIIPHSNQALLFLQSLSSKSTALSLDFWTYPTSLDRPVDIHLEPNYFPEIQEVLKFNNISFRLLFNNLQTLIQREYFPVLSKNFDERYHSYPEILRELYRLTTRHRNHSKLIDIGTTYEFRKIYAIEIFENKNYKKPLIFLNCGLHAREWLSPATCMFIVRQLLGESASNATSLRNDFTWIILPVSNVDGYQYSMSRERLWRKNRSVGPRGCIGVDLNRNFNHHWGGFGTSDDPCNLLYAGRFPFSEPETYALAKYLLSRRKELKVFLDMHAFGQLFMSPWGHTTAHAPHYKYEQEPLMKRVSRAIAAVNGRKFNYGPASIVIYPTTGDATDWIYGALGVVHAYSIELRPTFQDERGFLVSESEIVKSGGEILNGLVELARNLKE